MNSFRVLVTGSRNYTDYDYVYRVLSELDKRVKRERSVERIVLVHGGARGLDSLAAEAAESLGWVVEPHLADWEQFGKKAGFIRNKEMVDSEPDVCLAFPVGESRGTRMTVDLCLKAGVKTKVFERV